MEAIKPIFDCNLVLWNKKCTVKTIISLGEFDKLSKAESIRKRIQASNPDRVVLLDVHSRIDTQPYSLFVENKDDALDNEIVNLESLLE